jgi:hypothetical protein
MCVISIKRILLLLASSTRPVTQFTLPQLLRWPLSGSVFWALYLLILNSIPGSYPEDPFSSQRAKIQTGLSSGTPPPPILQVPDSQPSPSVLATAVLWGSSGGNSDRRHFGRSSRALFLSDEVFQYLLSLISRQMQHFLLKTRTRFAHQNVRCFQEWLIDGYFIREQSI